MRLLLDTCTFLWVIASSPSLSAAARRLFQDPTNETYLSVVSSWEIALKYAAGRLTLTDQPSQLVPFERERHRIAALALSEDEALAVHRLPAVHRDPFDRMLVSQAITRGMTILTPDRLIAQYPVPTAW